MAIDIGLFAVIARGICVPVFIVMAVMFWRKYKRSENEYFKGYFWFFIAITVIQLSTFAFDVLSLIDPSSPIGELSDARFPDHIVEYEQYYLFLENFVRPAYLLIIIILCIALATQVQPLEVIQNQKRILSRLLLLCVPLIGLMFIPIIRHSYYSFIAVLVALILIGFGLLFNIGVSLRLALKTVGEVQKRSVLILIGFILYIAGLGWSARVGWSSLINPEWGGSHDVILGSVVILISTLLYYLGYRTSKI